LLACSLIVPAISATGLSNLNYNVFSGEGEIAMVGDIEIGLVKCESVGYLVVPTGTEVVSLYGELTSLEEYKSYLEDYTIEGYSIDDIDVYSVRGVAYALDIEFIGFKGSALENNGGVLAKGIVQHYINGDWTQQ